MITFLEFVAEKLMGPPAYSRSWRCPFHDDNTPSFAVNPPKQRPDGSWHPIKFRCHGCGKFGDEWDLIKRYYPNDVYTAQLKRLVAYQKQYERLFGVKAEISNRGFPSPGQRGIQAEQLAFCCSELRSVIRDRGLDWSEEEAGFMVLLWADYIASREGVTMDEFVRKAASELIEMRGHSSTREALARRLNRANQNSSLFNHTETSPFSQ